MKKKYLIRNEKGFLTLMTGFMSLSALLGFFAGATFPTGGPKTEVEYLAAATEIRMYIEDAVEENIDIETIESEAVKMGNKSGLDVILINHGPSKVQVNIILELANKYAKVSSFDVELGGW